MWLYVPFPSARGSEGSTLPLTSPASTWDSDALSRSVSSSGRLLPSKSWLRVWKTAAFQNLRSFLTCAPSTVDACVDLWISSLPGYHANPIPWPVNNADMTTNEHSGPNSYEWWEKYDQQESFWKMCLNSSSTSAQLERLYQKWATELRSRYSLQRKNAASRTRGKESSSSPTMAGWKTPHGMNGVDATGKQGAGGGGEFAKQATGWPTPRSEDAEACGNHPNAQDSLGGVSRQWTTPQAHDTHPGDSERTKRKSKRGGGTGT